MHEPDEEPVPYAIVVTASNPSGRRGHQGG
jgi:hypothetical protein